MADTVSKADLREIALDLLSKGADPANGDDVFEVSSQRLDALCKLAGLGSLTSALDELERDALADAEDEDAAEKYQRYLEDRDNG